MIRNGTGVLLGLPLAISMVPPSGIDLIISYFISHHLHLIIEYLIERGAQVHLKSFWENKKKLHSIFLLSSYILLLFKVACMCISSCKNACCMNVGFPWQRRVYFCTLDLGPSFKHAKEKHYFSSHCTTHFQVKWK